MQISKNGVGSKNLIRIFTFTSVSRTAKVRIIMPTFIYLRDGPKWKNKGLGLVKLHSNVLKPTMKKSSSANA